MRYFSPQAYALEVKKYEGMVNDFAQVLSAETKLQLEGKLQQEASRQNGTELAVVTLSSLEDQPIESVALAYFDQWQIGKKGEDNGVLLLLAINDREIRIHTGYGVEGSLPDGMAGRIIRQDIVPHLQNDDYDAAVIAGVDRILAQISNPEQIQNSAQGDVSVWTVILIMLILFGIIGLFIYLVAKYAPKTPGYSHTTSSSRSPFSSPKSSSSSSSRSFSFGGGRSGGGGASGKW